MARNGVLRNDEVPMKRGERMLQLTSAVICMLALGSLFGPASAQVTIQRGWSAVTTLIFEVASTAGVRLDLSSGTLEVREGDDSVYGTILGNHQMPYVRATTNYTVLASDQVVASGSYTGPFTVTLPSATGLAGKILLIKDDAGLAVGTSNRTITVTGMINAGNSTTITMAFGVARLMGGVSSGSSNQWFTW